MRCLTTGTIPGKAINDDKLNEQETFKEQELEPHIEEAKAGKRALFFGDAAHFVHGAFIAKLWCFARLFMPTPSGRKRLNVSAAQTAFSSFFLHVLSLVYVSDRKSPRFSFLKPKRRCLPVFNFKGFFNRVI